MESLNNPHWEVMPAAARQVLQTLARATELVPFYLAGGTALALRLGHRVSVDLDFFGFVEIFEDEQRNRIIKELSESFAVEVERNSSLALTVNVDRVSVSFFTYTYPLLDELQQLNDVPIAGLADIGLMKVETIADRGARKDFIDLYCIARQLPLEELFEASRIKYPGSRFFGTQALEGLIDFEIADAQAQPQMLVPIDWGVVKQFFISEAVRLGKQRFEDL